MLFRTAISAFGLLILHSFSVVLLGEQEQHHAVKHMQKLKSERPSFICKVVRKVNMKKEWALENASHKYWSFKWILSRLGVLVLLSASVLIVKLLRPEYGTIDIVVILSAGMILGAFYVQSQDKIGERFKRKVEEIETKHPDS